MTVDPLQVSLLGHRFMRDFLHATIPLPLDDPRPYSLELTVIGLRPSPKGVEPRVRYLTQPWTITVGAARSARPEEVHLAFPEEPGPANIGKNEPWFDFAGGTVSSAIVGRGAVRRFPGAVSPASVAGLDLSWVRERMDGMTGKAPQAGTYLVGRTQPDGADAS